MSCQTAVTLPQGGEEGCRFEIHTQSNAKIMYVRLVNLSILEVVIGQLDFVLSLEKN